MPTASDYRKLLRKTITLPTGMEIEIRRLSGVDFLSVGEVPLAYQAAVRAKDRTALEDILKSDPGLEKRINDAVILNGVVTPVFVDKPVRECGDDEISLREIPTEDQMFIVESILALNNMTPEAGKSIRRFPEESASPGDGGRDGGEVRETPDRNP